MAYGSVNVPGVSKREVEAITGEVDVKKDGTLQAQIEELKGGGGGKTKGFMILDKNSLSLGLEAMTGTITVERPGNGAITALSSNTSVATVSVNGNVVTVSALKNGSATVTIKVAEGTNYTAPGDEAIAVTASGIPDRVLANNTPEIIKAVAQRGMAASFWSVGDKIGIALNGKVGDLTLNDTYYAFILGFNHNSDVEGGNSIDFQFGKTSDGKDIAFVDSKYNSGVSATGFFSMNSSNTNTGGWSSSQMRTVICPAFLAALPAAWRGVIADAVKYSDNTGGGSDTASYVTQTTDKIFLLSEYEVQGTRSYANSAEKNYQKQYDYYKNGNSKVKYKHNSTDSTCYWWLRSVNASNSDSFCGVPASGEAYYSDANYSCGFAPGFKVA